MVWLGRLLGCHRNLRVIFLAGAQYPRSGNEPDFVGNRGWFIAHISFPAENRQVFKSTFRSLVIGGHPVSRGRGLLEEKAA